MKVLYIVTSSKEFNTGEKRTQKGQDRFLEILVPALLEGVESMVPTWNVDVYLILGYRLSEERRNLLQNSLPSGVGLQVWNEATPTNYEFRDRQHRAAWLSEMPMSLARQHRCVVKDKLPYYDFFMAYEDDMLITKQHIDYHLHFQRQIRTFKPISSEDASPTAQHQWWGDLSREQIQRLRPGFIRVEVLTDTDHLPQEDPGPMIPNIRSAAGLDPSICCHHSKYVGQQGHPTLSPNPTMEQIVLWETAIAGLTVRQLPNQEWVALLPIVGAPNVVPGYWSGTNGALLPDFPKKPSSSINDYMAQSAGWMATREEILAWDTTLCQGSFLPPFDSPHFQEDGMGIHTESVEYWSGSLQLWGQDCGIQRVVSLDPRHFSNHLIYHTANNKQKEIQRERLILAKTLWGQLQMVQRAARDAMMTRIRANYGWLSFMTFSD